MPYSITTKDGITIDNIPDNVPSDAATLKERVAQMRASKGPSAPPQEEAAKVIAPNSGLLMGLRDPIDAGAQMLRRIVPDSVGNAVDSAGQWLHDKGFPVAATKGVKGVDDVVSGVNKQYDKQRGEDAGFDVARLAGNIINPVNAVPGVALVKGANTIGSLAARGALSGAIGGGLQPVTDTSNGDFASQKAGQVGLGAAGGAIATPAVTRAVEAIAPKVINAVTSIKNRINPPAAINPDVATANVFSSQGVKPADINDAMRQSVRAQVEEAINSKSKIDPQAFIRKAQFEAVGLKDDAGPTLGQMTRDPMQFAKEKNISGINIDGENGLATRFQAQNQRLQGVFDNVGATGATDRVTAGQTMLNALRDSDAPVKQGVDDLYQKARGMTEGRVADLDRAHFSTTANEALDNGMFNAFVPPNVRNLLNDITSGKGPFNVESVVQIDSLLSKAQRQAERSGDNAGSSAIGIIRNSLHDTPMMPGKQAAGAAEQGATMAAANDAARTVDEGITDVPFSEAGRTQIGGNGTAVSIPEQPTYSQMNTAVGPAITPPIDEGQAARDAFDQARRAARARFSTIEDTPALKAALDENAPDKFVQQYILGADVRDTNAMNKVLEGSPEAKGQARAQVADYLKRAAFGENPSGDKAFSADRYLKTIAALGPEKLKLFFTPDEIVKLNLAGKVASDINSIPVGAKYGTNTSGTAAAAVNAISGVLNKIPGGAILGVPINMAKREFGNYQTQKAIGQALMPQIANDPAQLSPELIRAFQALGIGSGLAVGTQAGAAARD